MTTPTPDTPAARKPTLAERLSSAIRYSHDYGFASVNLTPADAEEIERILEAAALADREGVAGEAPTTLGYVVEWEPGRYVHEGEKQVACLFLDRADAERAAEIQRRDFASPWPGIRVLSVSIGAALLAERATPVAEPDQGVIDQLVTALRRQHQWHLAQTEPDDEVGYVPADEYSDSDMCEQTMAALEAAADSAAEPDAGGDARALAELIAEWATRMYKAPLLGSEDARRQFLRDFAAALTASPRVEMMSLADVGITPQVPESDARALAELREALQNGEASDGCHTHRELYEYRMLYHAHAARGWLTAGIPVVKSRRHSDGERCFGGGWFIVVADLPTGQVSNHYRDEHWDLFDVPAVDLPPEYDGHTPADAADRLRQALRSAPPSVEGETRFRCAFCGARFDTFRLDKQGNRTCPECTSYDPLRPRLAAAPPSVEGEPERIHVYRDGELMTGNLVVEDVPARIGYSVVRAARAGSTAQEAEPHG